MQAIPYRILQTIRNKGEAKDGGKLSDLRNPTSSTIDPDARPIMSFKISL
jgi:hypothetical protein